MKPLGWLKGSAAIDSGSSELFALVDIDGETRPMGKGGDIGVDETSTTTSTGFCVPGGEPGSSDAHFRAASMNEAPGVSRRVVQAEALAWLGANPAEENASIVTSLPDVSELSELDLSGWREWFVDAVRRVVAWVPAGGVAIFYQSDIRLGGVWIDKGYLVMRGAEEVGATVIWHKIVCRKPPGTIALGRPSYSHMIGLAAEPRAAPRRPGPDVLPDAGLMPWSRAMGVAACRVACRFLREETSTRVVVDPFCGRGTVLAVANAMGFDALGVDVSAKRCRAARTLVVPDDLAVPAPPGSALTAEPATTCDPSIEGPV